MLLCIPFCSFLCFILSVSDHKRVISNLAFPVYGKVKFGASMPITLENLRVSSSVSLR
ncbi:protein of unknown function [Cupriavidus taiwanensis]|nr:protein of unknown function [Cupriavidus taiwanensis]